MFRRLLLSVCFSGLFAQAGSVLGVALFERLLHELL